MIQFALLMRHSAFYRWLTSRRPPGVWADYPPDSAIVERLTRTLTTAHPPRGVGARFLAVLRPYASLTQKCFSPREVAVLQAFEAPSTGFYATWTAPSSPPRASATCAFAVLDLTDLLRTEDVFSDAIHFHPGAEDSGFASCPGARHYWRAPGGRCVDTTARR
jgi:hypothetical protein